MDASQAFMEAAEVRATTIVIAIVMAIVMVTAIVFVIVALRVKRVEVVIVVLDNVEFVKQVNGRSPYTQLHMQGINVSMRPACCCGGCLTSSVAPASARARRFRKRLPPQRAPSA